MANRQSTPGEVFTDLLEDGEPQALAWVTGGSAVPTLSGLVKFYNTPYGGTLVEAELFGLPGKAQPGSSTFYGMHIHEGGDCSDNFQHTGGHLNPTGAPHPQHMGDLLPLFSNLRDTGIHDPGGESIGVIGADLTARLACSAYGVGGEFFVDLLIEKLLDQRHILDLRNQKAPFVCFKSFHTVCRKSPPDVVPGRKLTEIPKKGTVHKKQIGRVFRTACMFQAIVQPSPNLMFFFRKPRFQIFRKQEGESPHIIFMERDGSCFRLIFPMPQPLP